MELSMYIKTPQLIGIIAGVIVFTVTISVVLYLLYASGSFAKLAEELKSDLDVKQKKVDTTPQFVDQPQLYDELLLARTTLSETMQPLVLTGKKITLRNLRAEDVEAVHSVCNGHAVFHESAYDIARIWGWLDMEVYKTNPEPLAAANVLQILQKMCSTSDRASHLLIVDKELDKAIGMVSLIDNCPRNLSVQIDNVWITPAFQGQKRSHEAMLLVLEELHKLGYRRITAQVDERHVIGRKFLERCGFTLECVLRKHKILQQRNSNTALYVVLNSEWLDVERKLKHSLGINLAPENHKIAAIEQPESGRKALVEGSQVAHAKSSKKSSKNKKKVNH